MAAYRQQIIAVKGRGKMAKYIDADKIIDYANEEVTGVFCYPQGQRKLDEDAYREKWAFVRDIMIAAPAADVAPRWIPVTERLPAYGEDVLLSMNKDCSIGYLVPTYDERQYEWHHLGCFYDFNEVDAWMPLPSPFLGE